MVHIRKAEVEDTDLLAFMGRVTYAESHGHFIDNKTDLTAYLDEAFSVSNTKKDLLDANNLFYIITKEDFPMGYAKIVLGAQHESVVAEQACRLERIYILEEFIPHKLGQPFLTFLEDKARESEMDTMWLSVYILNNREIRFYQKNGFTQTGSFNFLVNSIGYDNFILSKKLNA